MIISSQLPTPAFRGPLSSSGSQWEDTYTPGQAPSVTLYRRPLVNPPTPAPVRPWMNQLTRMPGLSELRLEGADLHITPTNDFAGRALANLLKQEVDGYRLEVHGNFGPLELREALIYLRDLPGARGKLPTLFDGAINVFTEREAPVDFYNEVFGRPRGLDTWVKFRREGGRPGEP